MRLCFLGLVTLLVTACSPIIRTNLSKTYPALAPDAEVLILEVSDDIPAPAIELGTIKIKDGGFSTNCGWSEVIARAKIEARKAGGNTVKITKHIKPGAISGTCDQITAKILLINNSLNVKGAIANNANSLDTTQQQSEITAFKTVKPPYKKLRVGINGGYSYRIAKVNKNIPADLKQYINELKSGYHFGGNFSYFISEKLGFGLNYQQFRSQNEIDNIRYTDQSTGKSRTGKLKDDMTIQFFAPTMYAIMPSVNKKITFSVDVSIGYLNYKNNATVIDDFTLKGGTLGTGYRFGANFKLNKHLDLGLSIATVSGILYSYEKNTGTSKEIIKLEKDQREGLARIDAAIGLKYKL